MNPQAAPSAPEAPEPSASEIAPAPSPPAETPSQPPEEDDLLIDPYPMPTTGPNPPDLAVFSGTTVQIKMFTWDAVHRSLYEVTITDPEAIDAFTAFLFEAIAEEYRWPPIGGRVIPVLLETSEGSETIFFNYDYFSLDGDDGNIYCYDYPNQREVMEALYAYLEENGETVTREPAWLG